MAKKRSSAMTVYRAPPAYPRAAAPIIRISTPRAITPHKTKHKRRSGSTAGRGGSKEYMIGAAVGGAVVGFVEKSGMLGQLPVIPMLGKKGTFAVIGYWMGGTKKPGMMRDAILAAATLAGYELGKEGKISGDE